MPGAGATIEVLRPPARDAFTGDRSRPDGLQVHHTVDDVLVDWAGGAGHGSRTQLDRRETTVSRPTFYCPPDADVLATDYLRVAGQVFKVVGVPEPWQYDGWEPGLVVQGQAVR